MKYQISIYPAFNIFYYGFYLKGILSCVSSRNVKYTVNNFPRFSHRCFAFQVHPIDIKYYIDAEDSDEFDEQGLLWCDIYGKVNINPQNIPEAFEKKIIALGPNFGVRVWGFLKTAIHAIRTCSLCRNNTINIQSHFYEYWRQFNERLALNEYKHQMSDPSYIFFLSSIWAPEDECNQYRATFIQIASQFKSLLFEGGFAPPTRNDVLGIEQYTIRRRYSLNEYLSKLKVSAIAFNTPAVLNCHGWKLGEYLALGKAVISTPLTRVLPEPLVHGKHIHYVDGSPDSIYEAIYLICNDDDYRQKLENNAKEYFLQHLQPHCVIEKILRFSVDTYSPSRRFTARRLAGMGMYWDTENLI